MGNRAIDARDDGDGVGDLQDEAGITLVRQLDRDCIPMVMHAPEGKFAALQESAYAAGEQPLFISLTHPYERTARTAEEFRNLDMSERDL